VKIGYFAVYLDMRGWKLSTLKEAKRMLKMRPSEAGLSKR
jgi:hypothetical protein